MDKAIKIAVKKGTIENAICGKLASPFATLFGRGIWLWHDSIKGVNRSIKSEAKKKKIRDFYDQAWEVSSDKSIENVKVKTATIIKLWIEGISLCFKEMADDYQIMRSIFNNDRTYLAIDEISTISYRDFFDLIERAKNNLKGEEGEALWDFMEDKMKEVCATEAKYEKNSLQYKFAITKAVIEIICSCFIYVENMEVEVE